MPVAGALRGHSSSIVGPWASPPLHTSAPRFLPSPNHHTFYTSHSYTFYCSCSLLPATPPEAILMRLIVTMGHIGGNDLPRQGQRQLLQHLRQQNHRSSQDTEFGDFLWRCSSWVARFLSFLFFPSLLLIYSPGFGKLAVIAVIVPGYSAFRRFLSSLFVV